VRPRPHPIHIVLTAPLVINFRHAARLENNAIDRPIMERMLWQRQPISLKTKVRELVTVAYDQCIQSGEDHRLFNLEWDHTVSISILAKVRNYPLFNFAWQLVLAIGEKNEAMRDRQIALPSTRKFQCPFWSIALRKIL
jgi:hypothetical protein